jgi:hypothetical protein
MTEPTPDFHARVSPGGLTRALDNFGLVLVLILLSIALMASVGDSRATDAILVVTTGLTLLTTMRTTNVRRQILRLMTWILLPAIVLAVASQLFGRGDFAAATGKSLVAALALAAPILIIRRLVHHPAITVRTILGALCVYLLVGYFFAFLFWIIGSLWGPFFAQPGAGQAADFVYFSYVTMSTVGYGDLTAQSDVGRMLAVSEALLGQLYLVTIVALLVGNLGRVRSRGEQ